MSQYHYLDRNGQSQGPMESADLIAAIADGMLSRDTKVSKNGGAWRPAESFPELHYGRRVVAAAGAPPKPDRAEYENPPSFTPVLIFSVLLPFVGFIATIVYLAHQRHRLAGLTIFIVSLAASFVWFVIVGALS